MTFPGAGPILQDTFDRDRLKPGTVRREQNRTHPLSGEPYPQNDYLVPAVDKALRILRTLALSPDPVSLADLATTLALPKSTIHAILSTLAQRRFAERDGGGRWTLGLAAFEVGSAYAARIDLVTVFRSVAGRLAAECGHTVQLGMLDGRDVVYVAKADGTEPVRLVSREGTRLPAHTTALGKCILAFLPPEDFEHLYGGRPLTARTPYSIVSLQTLRSELRRIRDQGFAYDNEETALGLHCLAAPIATAERPAAASVSVAIPSPRMSESKFLEIKELVIRAAAEIAARMGCGAGLDGDRVPA